MHREKKGGAGGQLGERVSEGVVEGAEGSCMGQGVGVGGRLNRWGPGPGGGLLA